MSGKRQRWWRWAALGLLSALLSTRPGWAEDTDQRRYYLDVRWGESNPITNAHDVAGISLGLNLDRYLGFELAMDTMQLRVQPPSGRVADLAIRGFEPQVRLRYPFLDDDLVPYVFMGMGVAITQINDATEQVVWTSGNSDARALSTLGLGIEYFLRDNIAFGVEGKYFIMGRGGFIVHDQQYAMDLNTGTMTFGFRIFYPELHHPEDPTTPPRGSHWARFYGALRAGGALAIHEEPFTGVRAKPSQEIFGSRIETMLGGALGIDLGDYVGFEASFENYTLSFTVPGVGPIGKYAIFPILMQTRLRYPLLDHHLEPYLIGGLGAELAEPDKPNENAEGVLVSGRDTGLAGSLGAGIQYFVMDDVALDLELKYIISRDLQIQLAGQPPLSGNNDALFVTVGFRAYLFDF